MTESAIGSVGQDVRLGLRGLAKNPGFATVAVVTLALGIGSSTALFSVIENVLMEPFPYADSGRLMSLQIVDTERSEPGGRPVFTAPELLDYMEQNQAFDRAIASSPVDVLYTTGEGTERFEGYLVTPGTYEFFGMPALLGRGMVPADYEPGAPPVFVLRYKTWIARFSGDPGILNKELRAQRRLAHPRRDHASAIRLGGRRRLDPRDAPPRRRQPRGARFPASGSSWGT